MRNFERTLVFVATCTALLGLAPGLAGATVRAEAEWPIPRALVEGAVHAGDLVELRWAPQRAGVEELELLLSLDGGRSWHVRVSPQLSGTTIAYRWRVPNLPSGDARIRIRMRIDGRETEGAIGASFTIESDLGHPLTRSLLSEGAWWSGFEAPFDVAGGFGVGETASLSAARATTPSEEGPRFTAGPPATQARTAHARPGDLATASATRPLPRAPEAFPLRN